MGVDKMHILVSLQLLNNGLKGNRWFKSEVGIIIGI